jgi:hypothetical protein
MAIAMRRSIVKRLAISVSSRKLPVGAPVETLVDLTGMALFVTIVESGSLSAAGRAPSLPKARVHRQLELHEKRLAPPLDPSADPYRRGPALLTHSLVRFGRTCVLDVPNVEATPAAAETAVAASDAALADEQVCVLLALGGRWKP